MAALQLAREIPGSPAWHAANLLDAATRWCVPVFVMISGALMLERNDPTPTFLARRLDRLAPPLLFWSCAYLLLAACQPGWQVVHGQQALLRGEPWYHLWYLCMLPGLYLLTPWLRRLLQSRFARRRAPLAVAVLLGTTLVWLLPPAPSAWLRAPAFVAPYVAGHLLADAWHDRRGLALLSPAFWGVCWGIATALVALGAIGLLPLPGKGGLELAYDYASPIVMLQAVAVFMLGLQLRPACLARLAPFAFAVYLLHPALLLILAPVVAPQAGLVGMTLAACLLPLALAAVLLRLPGAARLLT